MRLDHLLSKDWLCVGCGSLAVILSGPCGSGRAWGACLAEGWAAGRRALVCGVVGLSGAGIGDAPAAGGLLRSCGCGGLVGGGCPRACVWGWHAVGVLG